MKTKLKRASATAARYAVPALDKGLDIVELLAREEEGFTLSEIARSLDRTPSELFRMVNTLCRRGYVSQRGGNRYSLTLQLFEMAHRHQPVRSLTAMSLPHMRHLASQSLQSCYLTIFNEGRVLVVAEVDNPERWTFSFKVGAVIGLTNTAPGYVLFSFQDDAERSRMLAEHISVPGETTVDRKRLMRAAQEVRRRGFERRDCPNIRNMATIACPIFGPSSNAVAALCVPYMERINRKLTPSPDAVKEMLYETAARLSLLKGHAN